MTLTRKNIAKSLFLTLALVGILLCMPYVSFADPATVTVTSDAAAPTGFQSLATYDKSSQFSNVFKSNSLAGYLNAIFTTVLSIGAILAVLRIAYAGYLYMGSADMWGNKQLARETLGDAIIGLLLLFGIYLILYQINPNLLNLNVLNINASSAAPAATVGGIPGTASPAAPFTGTGGPAEGSACSSGDVPNGRIEHAVCVPL